MAKQQRETDVANVLSQMSQLVQHPFDNGFMTEIEADASFNYEEEIISIEDSEHAYAQTTASQSQQPTAVRKQPGKGRKKHACNVCDRSFSKLCNLKSHLRVHSGERPHVCDLCSHAFANVWDLIRHNRTHSGEKPYKCSHCDRCFADFGSHRRHLRLHTKENPHKCHVCSKEFSRMDSFKNHMHTHSDQKPYYCKKCDKEFAYPSTYKRHLNSHSGEKRFSCDLCNKRFVRQDYLINHKRLHEKRMNENTETSPDSVINIHVGELLLCPSTEIESNSSYVTSADLSPIPILLSMAESAVVNGSICDGSEYLDSTALLAAASEIELGTSAEISTSHYDVSMDLESCSDIRKSEFNNSSKCVTPDCFRSEYCNIDATDSAGRRNCYEDDLQHADILNSSNLTEQNSEHFSEGKLTTDSQLLRHDISSLYRVSIQELMRNDQNTIVQREDIDKRLMRDRDAGSDPKAVLETVRQPSGDSDNLDSVIRNSVSCPSAVSDPFESQSFASCISISETNSSYSFSF